MRRMVRVVGLVVGLFALLAVAVPGVSAAGAERETMTFSDIEVLELTPEEAACFPGVATVTISYDATITMLTTPKGVIHYTFSANGTFEAMDGAITGTFRNHFVGKGTSLEDDPQVGTFVGHAKGVGPNDERIMLNQHAHIVLDIAGGFVKVDFYKVNCA